jgi:hypothetical protein
VPLPSNEGCGPVDVGEGGTTGETQQTEGPRGASTKPVMKIMGSLSRFSPQLTLFQSDNHDNSPNDNEQVQRQRGG